MRQTIFLFLLLSIAGNSIGQIKYNASSAKIQLDGTSTLHDWTMASDKPKCNAAFTFNGDSMVSLSSLEFTVPVESLKSDRKGLDKNAYKALNVGSYPEISFNSGYANIHSQSQDGYVITAKGKLTISGVTKDVWIMALARINPSDKSITTTGTFKIKMSEYNVERPTMMFGSVKAGDEVLVKFNVNLRTTKS